MRLISIALLPVRVVAIVVVSAHAPTGARPPAAAQASVDPTAPFSNPNLREDQRHAPVSRLAFGEKIGPGGSTVVALPISAERLAYRDQGSHRFVVEPGTVGASSADVRLRTIDVRRT